MDNEELDGVKFSEFPSQTPVNADEVVGLHSGDNARFSIANIVAAVRQGLASIFVPLTRTINSKALSTDISLDSSDIDYDNTGSGLTATDVQEAIDELAQGGGGGGGSAADITYDPTTSGASATNVQDALDEAFDDLDGKQPTITASGILKGDGQGGVTVATPGTDYATPAQLDGKANPGQIGYPESGTTASRNYSAGEYICWNGLTYTADTNIALGTTLSASGGNKNLTECVGGGLNSSYVTAGTVNSSYLGADSACFCIKLGNLRMVILCGYAASNAGSNVLGTVPSAFIPSNTVTAIQSIMSRNQPNVLSRVGMFTGYATLDTSGQITQQISSNISDCYLSIMFIY